MPSAAEPITPDPIRPPFVHPVRVYWEDTDAGGIVFYANYLKYFERARTEWLRACGIGQQRWLDTSGLMFVVTETAMRYLHPARLDDPLRVTVAPVELGRARMLLAQQAWLEDTLLCEGRIQIACVSQGDCKPRRIPHDLLERLTAPAP
jgi:acyl-CoA thioester hydrolase